MALFARKRGIAAAAQRVLPILLSLGCLQTSSQAEPRAQNKQKNTKAEYLSDLFRCGFPYGLIEFDVPNPPGSPTLSSPRVAVLDKRHGLRIFRAFGDSLVEEFALRPPDPTTWNTLQEFPSDQLPGVVLWSDAEEAHSAGIIVCYVKGKPRVIFRGGEFDLADLDGDGIPEIVQYPEYQTYTAKSVTVLTWNGRTYVQVKQMPIADLYSKDVVSAIRAAKKKPQTKEH